MALATPDEVSDLKLKVNQMFWNKKQQSKPNVNPSDEDIVGWLRNPNNQATQLMKAAINEWSAEASKDWGVAEGAVNDEMLGPPSTTN